MSSRPSLILPALALFLLGGLYLCTQLLDTAVGEDQVFSATGEAVEQGSDGLRPALVAGVDGESTSKREEVIVAPVFVEEGADAAVEDEETGPRLIGQVVRSGGAGIEGAKVILRQAQSWLAVPADVEEMSALSRYGPVHEAITDEEGIFEMRNVEPGDVALAIQADGFAPLTRMRVPVPKHEEFDLGRFQLEMGVRLSGEVNGPRGRGLEGVQVLRAISTDGGSMRLELPGHGIPVGETDAEGKFEVNSLPPGAWHLIFDHPGHRIAELKGKTEPAGRTEPGLLVSMESGLTIEGRVEGIDPVSEGPLRVTGRRDREQRSGAADDVEGAEKFRARHAEVQADGSFVLRGLAPGQQYKLRLYRPRVPEEDDPKGLPERWRHVRGIEDKLEMSGSKQVLLEYRSESSIALQVKSAKSGRVLEDFIVYVSGSGLGDGGLLKDDGADEPRSSFPGGEVLFEGLRPKEEGCSITVRVRAEGFEDFEKKNVMLRPGDELELGAVELEPAKYVRVKVVDKNTGEPIEKAHVVLAKSAERDTLDNWLKRTDRRPYADKKVRDGYTDEKGEASLTIWPNSICVLKAAAEGYLAGEEERSVIPHEELVEIQLDRGGRVTVRILDNDSNPVAGMFVEHTAEADKNKNRNVWYFNNSGGAENKSNELGEVVFSDLAKGKHSFKVLEKRNEWGGGGESAGHEADGDVYLDLGEEAELVLRVAGRGGYIATILESGDALVGCLAKLTPVDGGSNNQNYWFGGGQEDPRTRVSDHSGRVHFKQLKIGRYKLKISHPERRMSVEREILVVRDPSEEVLDIGLATIEGRVIDEHGDPIRSVSIHVREKGKNNDYDGGDYRVRITEDAEGDADWDYDQVSQWSIQTDENGEYRLRGVRPGCVLDVNLSNRYVVGDRREMPALGPDEYLSGVDFVLKRAGAVRVDVKGYPRNDRRRLSVVLERELPAEAGQQPRTERRSSRIRSWRPQTTMSSVKPGMWKLRVTLDGAQEPLWESDLEIVIGETARVTVQL